MIQKALSVGTLAYVAALCGCSDERTTGGPTTQVIRQGLTSWDIDRTRSEAEALALNRAVGALGDLDSAIQACLSNLGVTSTTISASCQTTPIQSNYTTPYPVVDGSQVGAECYWECKVEVTSEGVVIEPILILKELLTPTEVSGGC